MIFDVALNKEKPFEQIKPEITHAVALRPVWRGQDLSVLKESKAN